MTTPVSQPSQPPRSILHIMSAGAVARAGARRRGRHLGVNGYFGVLLGHAPLLAQLGAGELWYRSGTTTQHHAVAFV